MNTKKLVICHGDKGGVGKSTLAAAVIDYILDLGEDVEVVEGDSKVDDIARRYAGVTGVRGHIADLARADASEDAVIRLCEHLERSPANYAVINTPASASSTIDRQADLLVPAAQEIGYQVIVAWLVGAGEDSARLAAESELCRVANRKVAVINERFGECDKLVWSRHSALTEWIENGGLETTMGDLVERVASIVRESQGRPSTLTTRESGLPVITRHALHRWIQSVWSGPCAAILGEEKNSHE